MDVTSLRVPVDPQVTLLVRHRPGPAAPAFLLVHGLSSNARLWDEVGARLAAAGHPVYAVDLRGHGESDAPPEGYDTATAAADLAAIASGLGLAPVVLVGQSWGGNVAVRLAAEHPALVSALALVDGGWLELRADFGSWEECLAALHPPDLAGLTATALTGRLRAAHPDWSPAAVEATVANLRVGPGGRLTRRLSVDHHLAILRSLWEEPPSAWYPRVSAPALLLPAVPAGDPRRARRVRARVAAALSALGAARCVEYVDGDHDLHAQQPDRLAADLLGLARQVQAPEVAR